MASPDRSRIAMLLQRAAARSIGSASCSAEKANRSRAVPGGTVGGRIATTSRPCSSSIAEAASARSGSPTIDRHDRAGRRLATQGGRESPGVLERLASTAPAIVPDDPQRAPPPRRPTRAAAPSRTSGCATGSPARRSARTSRRHIPRNCRPPWRASPSARPPRCAEQIAQAVGVVGHQPGVVCAGQLAQLGDRPAVAVHAEDRLGQDQAPPESGRGALRAARGNARGRYGRTASRSRPRAAPRPTCRRGRADRRGSGRPCRPGPG